ncbi:MAG TPA: TylF/MycF/NovP-related O-methyltransferase [Chitinophagaceae bacterium]|nr:TylF/MycF/NovP-related O-methyltransferase [Chitinophagaceae bacterium]
MKFFIIRYTKIAFLFLRLHILFNWISPLFSNLYYLTKFSLWANKNRKIPYNDFPSKWDYRKRFDLYKWILEKENLLTVPVNYMEFGVAQGASFRWFLEQNSNSESRFYGFDTFTGLPEDFGPYKKGTFNNQNSPPDVNDQRAKFFQGLFQQTVSGFLTELRNDKRNIIMMDADLYSATIYVLTKLAPFLKKDDIIFFDEFSVPTHEFKAYHDFIQSYYINLELLAAANNYYFVAFRVT